MTKIDRKQIAYYGKPIETLARDELISALENLAGAIQDCAAGKKKCEEILQINESEVSKGDQPRACGSQFNKSVGLNKMVKKIVSGGQTGADRAALDVALKFDIPHGGWVPKGRKTEEGTLPDMYRLPLTTFALPGFLPNFLPSFAQLFNCQRLSEYSFYDHSIKPTSRPIQ